MTRRLTVVCSDRAGCYVALHHADATALFATAPPTRHFCRVLRLERGFLASGPKDDAETAAAAVHVGWTGEFILDPGRLEVSQPFAACLGLQHGEQIAAVAVASTPVAASVMLQPSSADDWEVVEMQASFLEQKLLAQVAVLAPNMVFPVWIHGQVAARLKVDAKDSNSGDYFLLSRDSELAVESRARAAREQGVSVFAPSSSAGLDTIYLRLFGFADDVDLPLVRVHAADLQALAGSALEAGCVAWLRLGSKAAEAAARPELPADASKAPGAADGKDGAAGSFPLLVQVRAADGVPRRHMVVGRCLAEYVGLQHFSILALSRCTQMPIFVPQLQLLPLSAESMRLFRSAFTSVGEHEERITKVLQKRLEHALESHGGDVYLMDGAVIQLRPAPREERMYPADEADLNADPDLDIEGIYAESEAEEAPAETSASAVDDDGAAAAGGFEGGCVVEELDLGLDEDAEEEDSGEQGGGITLDSLAGPAYHPSSSSRSVPWRETVQVRVQLSVDGPKRGAGGLLGGVGCPAFARVSSRSLSHGLEVQILLRGAKAPPGAAGPAAQSAQMSPSDTLASLWRSIPGLRFPDEAWWEVLELALPQDGPADGNCTPLDGLKLFTETVEALRWNLLAQLGETSADVDTTGEAKVPSSSTDSRPVSCGMPTAASPGACLLLGASGSGKSSVCQRVCNHMLGRGVMAFTVACGKLGQPGRKFKAVLAWIRRIFHFACWYAPSTIVFDDFAALCPDVESGAPNPSVAEDRSVIISEVFMDILHEVRASGAPVAIVVTAPNDSAVHTCLRRALAIEHKITLRPPELKERPEILRIFSRLRMQAGWKVSEELCGEEALDDWGGKVDGYGVADLERLLERACIEADAEAGLSFGRQGGKGKEKSLELRHLEKAFEDFMPSGMTNQSFLASELKLADIGGLDGPKQALMDMLTISTKYAALVDRAPVRGGRGLILVGPPGCGKTMLVLAAANETKGLLRFLTVKGPELLSKYIGASEAGVRAVFERAAAAAPSAIFFDEIEALCPKRGADSTGVTDRVVNQMLTYLDGVEDRGKVYVIAATGRPDLVDGALMRPGRFDKICYCGMPNDSEKLEIAEILAKKHKVVAEKDDLLAQLQRLIAKMPPRFTSADVNALFSSAKIEAVNEAVKASPKGGGSVASKVTFAHLHSALGKAKASVSEADERRYAKVFANFRPAGASGGASGLPAALGGPAADSSGRQKVALA
eukprot:TRINITY_DN73080_c0_g1_i2.p1 TRINITY_DN73080_c0_g1~~TRINITY_DN73080_c0_g1_i2.p1  ORF type:complete len:1228 (+),score=299.10 TRINITY_DN73080_c0_g1_i2:166-3849(+)